MSDVQTPDELHGAAAVEFAKRLRKVKTDVRTWEVEYIDDATGERWVLDYPHSELQGGGPPRLRRC
jgi:hypothetical protein